MAAWAPNAKHRFYDFISDFEGVIKPEFIHVQARY